MLPEWSLRESGECTAQERDVRHSSCSNMPKACAGDHGWDLFPLDFLQ